MQYILDHWLEIFGVITGLLFLYFEIRASIWLWPVGLISAMALAIVLFVSKFYADMGLQLYYVVISVYGWIRWAGGKSENSNVGLPIVHIEKRQILILSFITIGLNIAIYKILVLFTDSPIPGWDSFTTALSITATWMLTRKILEQWWLWIVVNFVTLGLYMYKDLYFLSFMYLVYGVMSVTGLINWSRMKRRNHE